MVGSWGEQVHGPTLVAIGGVHGNDPSGVVALTRLLQELEASNRQVQGRLVGLRGNRQALDRGARWIRHDLNRLWTEEQLDWIRFHADPSQLDGECREQVRLLRVLELLLSTTPEGRFYLLDLHSTSGKGAPFSIVNHQPASQRLASRFPVPMVFGLEDEIHGTLVSYFDSKGIPALGFEGGKHGSEEAVLFHLAILRLALVFTGILKEAKCPHFGRSMDMLKQASHQLPRAHQVRYRHPVQPGDQFRMEPDLANFQPVQQNQLLARDRTGEIRSPRPGRILMPLYQAQGDDGFFILDPIEKSPSTAF